MESVLQNSLIITGFIFTMMLLIEYVNVISHGQWQEKLSKSKTGQYFLAIIFGMIPGCLGSFTVVSLYSHGLLSFGALTGTMIATSGDEAYVMLSMFPEKALFLTLIIGLIGFVFAILTDALFKKLKINLTIQAHSFDIHRSDYCNCLPSRETLKYIKNISFHRALLTILLTIFILLAAFGIIAGDEENWVRVTLQISFLFALFVVLTVPDHFLEEHLWEHVLKKHFLRIFLWTFGTLAVLFYLQTLININQWIQSNMLTILFISVLIGLLPESGPHLIFITLFAKGLIPFSILLTSSIVQDGHGTLPLLAVSKRDFVIVKLINAIAGLAIGLFSLKILGV